MSRDQRYRLITAAIKSASSGLSSHTWEGVTVDVFADDLPSDVRRRWASEKHDLGIAAGAQG